MNKVYVVINASSHSLASCMAHRDISNAERECQTFCEIAENSKAYYVQGLYIYD